MSNGPNELNVLQLEPYLAPDAHVLVLFGGVSTEHLISCRSAYYILGGLRQAGFRVSAVGITKSGQWLPLLLPDAVLLRPDWADRAAAALGEAGEPALNAGTSFSMEAYLTALCGGSRPDVIFPAVHGINCEDGALQGILQWSGIPYVGSDVLASACAMDKVCCKVLVASAGVPQVPHVVCTRQELEQNLPGVVERVAGALGFPCFLKPANGGSSVGTMAAGSAAELAERLPEVARYDEKILIEAFVQARELEVAVLGNQTLLTAPVGEINTAGDLEYYDYEAKYFNAQAASVSVPADIDPALTEQLHGYARTVYAACGCAGLARVDFFIDKATGAVYFNEINTLPGFTAISVYPKAMAAAGLSAPVLLRALCCLAVQRSRAKARVEWIGPAGRSAK